VATVLGLLLVMAFGGIALNLHLQKALNGAREAEQGKTDKLWQSLLERAAAKRAWNPPYSRWPPATSLR